MNPMEQLKDIHLNPAVSQWPPAIGWWLLGSMILVLLTLTVIFLLKRHRRRQALRQALSELKQIQPNKDWPQAMNKLLKRACISYFPVERVANLHQQEWVEFLCTQVPEKKASQYQRILSPLANNLYRADAPEADFQTTQQVVSQWLKAALPPSKKQQEATHV